jgi:hypothetical protein
MKDQLQSLIDNLNQGFKTGTVSLANFSDSNFDEFGCEPDDIIIYVDFNDEDEPEKGQASNEYESAINLVNDLLLENNFEVVADMDGSGGGLYYGFAAYRKIT